MNKPDWKDAPEWANWLVQDRSGKWYWHEFKPEIIPSGKWENCGMKIACFDYDFDYRNSLEERPNG